MEFIKQVAGCYGPRVCVKFSHEELRPDVYGQVCKAIDPISSWHGADKVWFAVDKESYSMIYSWEFPENLECSPAAYYLVARGAKLLESIEEMISFFDGFTNFP